MIAKTNSKYGKTAVYVKTELDFRCHKNTDTVRGLRSVITYV